MHMNSALVDTNILVYIVDTKEKEKHAKALDWYAAQRKNKTLCISIQNLREFAAICVKKTSLGKEKIMQWIEDYSSAFWVLNDSQEDIIKAVETAREKGIPYYDGLLAATMERHGLGTIITENARDFNKHGRINVVDFAGLEKYN